MLHLKDGNLFFFIFRSIGEVFFLTSEGHIDVMPSLCLSPWSRTEIIAPWPH